MVIGFQIRVVKGPAIYVSSAFTPNGDGSNDVFRPIAPGMTSLEFRVFNRFGQLVFETHNTISGWNGTYRGTAQPSGNYVWMLKATDRLGAVRDMSGNVILIR